MVRVGSDRRKIRDFNYLPGESTRSFNLEIHILCSKLNSSFVVVRWHSVFVGNVREVVELVKEHVRDIHEDPPVFTLEELGVPVHCLSTSRGVKLGVECVPV